MIDGESPSAPPAPHSPISDFVDLFAMANLDNQDGVRRFYPIDHAVVPHTESASAFQTVS